ncbi:hypothetical protein FOMPIDRAFT_1106331, partial [Fomitopsis schrenkii]
SLLDVFPKIKASVLLEIARHEFEPSDLYKLDLKFRDKAERSVLDLTGDSITLRKTSTKDYPSYNSLVPPLTVYFSILSAFVASSNNISLLFEVTRATMMYLHRLELFREEYQWSAVLAYHMDFHHLRLREMAHGDFTGWGRIDSELKAEYLVGKERSRVTHT